MRFYKLRVTPNAAEIASEFNAQFKPEIISEKNDPFRVDWINEPSDDVFVGEAVTFLLSILPRVLDNPKIILEGPSANRSSPPGVCITMAYSWNEIQCKRLFVLASHPW
jgi:hypothetical protein